LNPQIEQLRGQFSGMNNAQRKQFIEKLKQKLQGSNNAEYSKFLNECIQKYNAGVNGDSTGSGRANTSTPVPQSKNKNTIAPPTNCTHCGELVLPTQKTCLSCFMPNESFRRIDRPSLILAILGLVLPYILPIIMIPLMIPLSFFIVDDMNRMHHGGGISLGSTIGLILMIAIPFFTVIVSFAFSVMAVMLARKRKVEKNTKAAYVIGLIGVITTCIALLNVLLTLLF